MTPLAAALALSCAVATAPAATANVDSAPAAPAAEAVAAPRAGLPFVEDDYGAALADARSRGVPLVVDAWAPW